MLPVTRSRPFENEGIEYFGIPSDETDEWMDALLDSTMRFDQPGWQSVARLHARQPKHRHRIARRVVPTQSEATPPTPGCAESGQAAHKPSAATSITFAVRRDATTRSGCNVPARGDPQRRRSHAISGPTAGPVRYSHPPAARSLTFRSS